MIGVDTNILVRAYLEDDKNQASLAQKFLKDTANGNKLFISSYAILEFAWVLKVNKFTRREIYNAILSLIDSVGVTIGEREVIIAASENYIKGKGDFGDYIIMAEGEKYSAHKLKTFDKAILKELPLKAF